MKQLFKYPLITVGGALLLLILVFGIFLNWALSHASIDQGASPVSRERAQSHVAWLLPSAAHDIQYATFACGFQDYRQYVRFEAPVADCYAAANTIFSEDAKANPRYLIPQFQPVSHPERVQSSDLRIDWFDNDQISRGIVAGTGWREEPKIWIDQERGIFYYELGD